MSGKIIVKAEVFKEGDQYVGVCPELNVSSFGDTPEEAKKSLSEAVSLFLEECQEMGTLVEVLKEAGFTSLGQEWIPPEPILIDKLGLDLARVE
ncbi:MAG: type II toxin-antitoxin system HicB family antitoxin [Elusimicrobiota bacterium]